MIQFIKNTKATIKRFTAGFRKAHVRGYKICPECEGEMQSYDVPIEKVVKIPFTGREVVLRNWNGKEWYCYDCTRDGHQRRYEEAFDAGMGEGFARGYNEAVREGGKFY